MTWGGNTFGQLGLGGSIGVGTGCDSPWPAHLPGEADFPDAIAIASGVDHTLALRSDGSVWAWGRNDEGQLGRGSLVSSGAPAPVLVAVGVPLDRVIAIGAGDEHSLAVRADGKVWTWGSNAAGQLGRGVVGLLRDPLAGEVASPAFGIYRAIAVTGGDSHSLAIMVKGPPDAFADFGWRPWGWGNNGVGQIGGFCVTPCATDVPVEVVDTLGARLLQAVELAAGCTHSLALVADGTLWSWGANDFGQLGRGPLTASDPDPQPVAFAASQRLRDVAAGDFHSLAVEGDAAGPGYAWAWGANGFGQLGDDMIPTLASFPVSVLVDSVTGPAPLDATTVLGAGQQHSLALFADGGIVTWGDDSEGQLGDGTSGPGDFSPVARPTSIDVQPPDITGWNVLFAVRAGPAPDREDVFLDFTAAPAGTCLNVYRDYSKRTLATTVRAPSDALTYTDLGAILAPTTPDELYFYQVREGAAVCFIPDP